MYITNYIMENTLGVLLNDVVTKYIEPVWNDIDVLHYIALVLIIIVCVLINELKKKNNELAKYKPKALSYEDLCIKISVLLENNNSYFRSFAPNSSAVDSDEPLREDTTIWENVKETVLVVNNKAIKELINSNRNLIPSEHLEYFTKMEHHIVAFEAHVKNPQFDYSAHKFPHEFDQLIRKECFSINEKQTMDIRSWLMKELTKEKLDVDEMFLYGSILNNYFNDIKDVDLLLLYKAETQHQIIAITTKLNNICKRFHSRFRKTLHLTAFSSIETTGYNTFKSKLNYKREV